MKTEQQIESSIEKVKASMLRTFQSAIKEFEDEKFNECSETLFTLLVNVAALEAAQRILE